MSTDYDGRQYVGRAIGLGAYRQRPGGVGLELAKAGPDPEVVPEATYGWYWAVDVLQAAGARVHLAHRPALTRCGTNA